MVNRPFLPVDGSKERPKGKSPKGRIRFFKNFYISAWLPDFFPADEEKESQKDENAQPFIPAFPYFSIVIPESSR